MQAFDLEPFAKYIKERGLANERNIPYYVQWVQKFLTANLPDIATSPRDRIQAFENLLAQNHTLQDWQVWQALKAVELYVKVFVSTADSEPIKPDDQEKAISEADRIYIQMRDLIRVRHYSYRTEQTYLDWVRRYFGYALNHELDWQKSDTVRAYLSSLATQKNVAASTQNQAFSALLFLLREVLKQDNPDLKSVKAKQGSRLPLVLSQEEVRLVLKMTPPVDRLLLQLAYGAGLRVSELVRLRVKDLDFDNLMIIVRAAKGNKDRGTLLSKKLVDPLKAQIAEVKRLHAQDLAAGHGAVYLPFALDRKYPLAPKEFGWQYLFPASDLAVDPRSGVVRRHHISDQVPQRIMRDAVRKAGISKPASIHCLRHSFATHMLLKGTNIREVQKYLGHESVETTMIYTHVIRGMDSTAESPLDEL
jgi:integron integrase